MKFSFIHIKKWLSPLLYVVFVILSLIAVFILLNKITEMSMDCTYTEDDGVTVCTPSQVNSLIQNIIQVSFLLIPGFMFLLGNVIIERFEVLQKPRIMDHIRQTFLLYIPLFLVGYTELHFQIIQGESWDAPGAYILAIYCVFAIMVNAGYLILRRIWIYIQYRKRLV